MREIYIKNIRGEDHAMDQLSLDPAEIHELNHRREAVRAAIELMTKQQHVEVLHLLSKSLSAKLNETRSGVYVNMAFLSESALKEIELFITHHVDQESYIRLAEDEKIALNSTLVQK